MSETLSEQFRLAAKEWVEADSAATLLEETKSAVLSQRMAALGDKPVSRAEMEVKASEEWRKFIQAMVTSRKEANFLKVKLEWLRMRFQEWSSAEATKRAEMKI